MFDLRQPPSRRLFWGRRLRMSAVGQPATASSSFWKDIESEVVTFALTVFLGLLLRAVSSHRLPGKKWKTCNEAAEAACANACQPARQRLLPTGANAGSVLASPAARSPAQLVEQIFACFKEQQGMKTFERALSMYRELRRHLRDSRVPLVEVAGEAKWSALDLYSALVRSAIRASKFSSIEGLLDDMAAFGVPRTLVFYEGVMKQLAGQHQYRLALRMHGRLINDGFLPSDVTYSCLISFAVEVEQYDKALQLYAQLVQVAEPPIRACMMVLRVHAKRQDWPRAVGTLRGMQERGPPPDSLALNVVLATGVAVGELGQAEALLKEFSSFKTPIVDVVSFNTVLKGHARQGNVEGVSGILEQLQHLGVSPTVITFNTSMDGALRGGNIDQVWEFWSTMKEAGLRSDRFTCSILVRALSRSATAEHVEFVCNALRDVDGASSGCARAAKVAGCRGAATQSGECGGWPDEALRDSVYNSVFQAAVDSGSAQAISRTLCHMRDVGVAPVPSSKLLTQLRQHAADTDLCSKLWRDLSQGNGLLTPCVFSAMLDECMAQGRLDKAIAAFEELRSSRRDWPLAGERGRRRSGSGSSVPGGEPGAADEASPSAVAAGQDGFVTECRARLLRSLCSAGREQEATKLYKQAVDEGDLAAVDTQTVELVARAQVAAGSLERAWATFEDQLALGRKLGDAVIRIFLTSCVKQSNAQYARALFQQATVGALDLAPSAYAQIIQLHARRGELEDVLLVFQYMTKRAGFQPPPEVFPATLRACLASVHPHRARSALQTLQQLAPKTALDASFNAALSRVTLGALPEEAWGGQGAYGPTHFQQANTSFNCSALAGDVSPRCFRWAQPTQ